MTNDTLSCCVCEQPMNRCRDSKPQGEAAHDRCRRATIVNHGEAGYGRGCRCDICREAKNARMRRYTAARRARDLADQGTSRSVINCHLCRGPLKNVRPNQSRYPLHKKCRIIAPDWMRRQRDNPRRAKFQSIIDKAAAGTAGGRTFTCGACKWCGSSFVGYGAFCSRRCATSQKYADRSQRSFKISPKERVEIYERDGWVCQLCNKQVDSALHYLDNWSATLDHIVPQSHMLIPDHSPSNLRLAHRWCNSARGDGSNMTEIQFHVRIAELETQVA